MDGVRFEANKAGYVFYRRVSENSPFHNKTTIPVVNLLKHCTLYKPFQGMVVFTIIRSFKLLLFTEYVVLLLLYADESRTLR